jgi:hypothetical protein
MNPAEKIEALEKERDALKMLLVSGISEQERIALHQRIVALDSQITGWLARLPLSTPVEPVVTVTAMGSDGILFTAHLTRKKVERTDGNCWFRLGLDGHHAVDDFQSLLEEHKNHENDIYQLKSVTTTSFDGFMKGESDVQESDVQESDAFACILAEKENEGYHALPKKNCVLSVPPEVLSTFNDGVKKSECVPKTLEFDGIASKTDESLLFLECKHRLTQHDVKVFQRKVECLLQWQNRHDTNITKFNPLASICRPLLHVASIVMSVQSSVVRRVLYSGCGRGWFT